MKAMKKVFAILVVVAMVMGLSLTAFAEGETYSITINDAANGETYTAYKIFDATKSTSTSYEKDENGTYYHYIGTDTAIDEYTTTEPNDLTDYEKDTNDAAVMYKQVITEHYSYSIATGSEWLSVVLNYMGYTYDETTSTWKDAESNTATSPFSGKGLTLTLSGDGSQYDVEYVESDKEGAFSAPDFAAALNTAVHADGANYTKAAYGTASIATGATTASVTLDVSTSGAGYYFVDTSLGSLCSLDTVVGTEQVIYEKNSIPSIKKYVLEDDNNTYHTALTTGQDKNYDTETDYAVLDVIDTVYYKLVVDTGSDNYSATDGTGVDANYVIVDTLPTGIVLNGTSGNNYTVVVTTDTGAEGTTETWDAAGNYTVSYDTTKNELTITLLASGKLATLAENTKITITYNAKMVADGDEQTTDVTVNGDNINTVTLTYQKQTSTSKANVKTYQLVPTVTVEGEGQPAFVKVDGTTNSPLEGVKFVLSRTVNGTTQYAVVDTNGYLTEWTTDRDGTDENATDATKLTTNADGTFNVKGLDAGTYILTETETLEGYNLLTDTITVVIAEDGKVTYQYTSKIGGDGETAGSTITVVNETGTELPSTGGIGTTIFYVVGSILVIGAAVLLITKKRMTNVQ